jgi:hypothetical protein
MRVPSAGSAQAETGQAQLATAFLDTRSPSPPIENEQSQ